MTYDTRDIRPEDAWLTDPTTGRVYGFQPKGVGTPTIIGDAQWNTDIAAGLAAMGMSIVDFPYWAVQVVCGAGATTTANGTTSGVGDVLGKVDYVVNTAGATATLTAQDGTGTTYTLNPTGGFTAAGPGSVELGYTALIGAWKITCGAGLTAVASLL